MYFISENVSHLPVIDLLRNAIMFFSSNPSHIKIIYLFVFYNFLTVNKLYENSNNGQHHCVCVSSQADKDFSSVQQSSTIVQMYKTEVKNTAFKQSQKGGVGVHTKIEAQHNQINFSFLFTNSTRGKCFKYVLASTSWPFLRYFTSNESQSTNFGQVYKWILTTYKS